MNPEDLEAQVLRHLPLIDDPQVLVGTDTSDDAAVYQLNDEQAIVVTLDYFTPVVDTPYEFGQIAAANSLSDVYAMGATPLVGLNVVGFPAKSPDLTYDILRDILKGGADKAREAGIFIAGGHTVDDDEPKYGLVAIGVVHPAKVVRNIGACVGDHLILTKPIGTGIVSTAIKNDVAPASVAQSAITTMSLLNKGACEAMVGVGANAATDVTGFGLLGHLREMTSSSRVRARIHSSRVPIIEGVLPLAEEDYIPGGSYANMDFLSDAVQWEEGLTEVSRLILCDAQTSGGLLMAVPPDHVEPMLRALARPDVLVASDIGEIIAGEDGKIEVAR